MLSTAAETRSRPRLSVVTMVYRSLPFLEEFLGEPIDVEVVDAAINVSRESLGMLVPPPTDACPPSRG